MPKTQLHAAPRQPASGGNRPETERPHSLPEAAEWPRLAMVLAGNGLACGLLAVLLGGHAPSRDLVLIGSGAAICLALAILLASWLAGLRSPRDVARPGSPAPPQENGAALPGQTRRGPLAPRPPFAVGATQPAGVRAGDGANPYRQADVRVTATATILGRDGGR